MTCLLDSHNKFSDMPRQLDSHTKFLDMPENHLDWPGVGFLHVDHFMNSSLNKSNCTRIWPDWNALVGWVRTWAEKKNQMGQNCPALSWLGIGGWRIKTKDTCTVRVVFIYMTILTDRGLLGGGARSKVRFGVGRGGGGLKRGKDEMFPVQLVRIHMFHYTVHLFIHLFTLFFFLLFF